MESSSLSNPNEEEEAPMSRFRLVAVGLCLALVCAVAQAKDHPVAHHALQRTHQVIVHAAHAVKKGGEGKVDLRKAAVHQRAARAALHNNKPAVAMSLTLKARAFARAAIKANKGETLTQEESTDAPEETQAAQGASEADANAAVAEADKAVPSAEQVAQDPNAGDPAPAGE